MNAPKVQMPRYRYIYTLQAIILHFI